MSKRDLKKYLTQLSKDQLEEQVLDLYSRFKEVKTFYNFVFQPKEEKLLEDAKVKIGKEYFPTTKRKAKARRSVAQKIIKHWLQLGVDSYVIAEIMFYNLEITMLYSREKTRLPDAFFKSMLNSYIELVTYVSDNGYAKEFGLRLQKIANEVEHQKWINSEAFQKTLTILKEH
jgi:hypothetical protein